ncbi:unnamed protein product, partial [Allacma fusca]
MSAFLRRVSRTKEKSDAELTVPEEIVKYCGGIKAPPNSFESMTDSVLDGTQAPKNSLENEDDDSSSPLESDSIESPYTASLQFGKGEDLVISKEPDKFSFRDDLILIWSEIQCTCDKINSSQKEISNVRPKTK